MAKVTLDGIVSGFKSVAKLISNFDSIESELNDKVLYRDNPSGEPNQMVSELDMNGQPINNLPTATNATQPVTLAQLQATTSDTGTALSTSKNSATGDGIVTVYSTPALYVLGGNNLSVYLDGVYQNGGYTETSTSSVTFTTPPGNGVEVVLVVNARTVETPIPTDMANVTGTYEAATVSVQTALNDIRSDLNTVEGDLTTAESDIDTAEGNIVTLQADVLTLDPVVASPASSTMTATANRTHLITNRSVTATLPASPEEGDRVRFISNDHTNQQLVIKPAAGHAIVRKSVDSLLADIGSGSGVLVDFAWTTPFDDMAGVLSTLNDPIKVINLTTGDSASVTAFDAGTNTFTCVGATFTHNDEYVFGYTSTDGFKLVADSPWNAVELVYRVGLGVGLWTLSIVEETTITQPSTRLTGFQGILTGDTETTKVFLNNLDHFLSIRLDSSNSQYNLANSTTTAGSGSPTSTGAINIPVSVYWEGEGDLYIAPNEATINADHTGLTGPTIGDREVTTVYNMSAGDDMFVTITGLTTTTKLTLINGTQNTVTSNGISFTANNTIADSNNGLGVYAVGDLIKVTNAGANNGNYEVATVAAGTITTVETTITTAGAGTSTITSGAYRGSGDITIHPGCVAHIKRLSNTEVLVYSSNSAVVK